MLNNVKLKETLSQKVTANTTESTHAPTTSNSEPSGSEPMLPSLSVVLTFSLSLAEAPSQMKRIQEMFRILGLQPAVQQQPAPLPLKLSQSLQKPASLPSTTLARGQASAKNAASTAPMTDKQKRMIFALVAKKKLTPDQVESLLMKQIGHARGSDLTKLEASSFINMLLAM